MGGHWGLGSTRSLRIRSTSTFLRHAFAEAKLPSVAAALTGIARVGTLDDAAAAKRAGAVGGGATLVALAAGKGAAVLRSDPLPVTSRTTAAAAVGLALDVARAAAEARLGEEVPAAARAACGCGKTGGAAASASASGDGAHAHASAGDGGKKKKAKKGGKATTAAKDAGAFYQSKKSPVHSLGETTLPGFIGLVEFYAPWCGHCKALTADFEKAARSVARGGRGAMGAVDCTVHQALCQTHGVQGYPTLIVFHPGGRAEPYQGPRDAASLADVAAAAAPPPEPEIVEITSQEDLDGDCLADGTRLCLLALLPQIADTTAAERTAAIASLKAASLKFAGRPFAWAWAAGGSHPGLEAAVEATYGFPALVAVARPPSAGPDDPPKIAHLKGAFTATDIARFVERARAGGAGAAPARGALVAATVAPWDGADAPKGEAMEDEFSLEELMKGEL